MSAVRAALVASALAVLACAGGGAPPPAAAATAPDCHVFNGWAYTAVTESGPTAYACTVPFYASRMLVVATGAPGGVGDATEHVGHGVPAYVRATVTVRPHARVLVYIGEKGHNANTDRCFVAFLVVRRCGKGGFGGGGTSLGCFLRAQNGSDDCDSGPTPYSGGGGGGASEVDVGGTPVVIAAGAGGDGGVAQPRGQPGQNGRGGDAGAAGTDGTAAAGHADGGKGGGAATTGSGGVAGRGGVNSGNASGAAPQDGSGGSHLSGGDGGGDVFALCSPPAVSGGGGGGGGGWYGGGGGGGGGLNFTCGSSQDAGSGGGGGGGSSLAPRGSTIALAPARGFAGYGSVSIAFPDFYRRVSKDEKRRQAKAQAQQDLDDAAAACREFTGFVSIEGTFLYVLVGADAERACTQALQRAFRDLEKYLDPPDADHGAVALPARMPVVGRARCARLRGRQAARCRAVAPAARRYEAALARLSAVEGAIVATMDRGSSAERAGAEQDVLLQMFALAVYRREERAAERAVNAASMRLAAQLRHAGVDLRLSGAAVAATWARLREARLSVSVLRDLGASGITASELRSVLSRGLRVLSPRAVGFTQLRRPLPLPGTGAVGTSPDALALLVQGLAAGGDLTTGRAAALAADIAAYTSAGGDLDRSEAVTRLDGDARAVRGEAGTLLEAALEDLPGGCEAPQRVALAPLECQDLARVDDDRQLRAVPRLGLDAPLQRIAQRRVRLMARRRQVYPGHDVSVDVRRAHLCSRGAREWESISATGGEGGVISAHHTLQTTSGYQRDELDARWRLVGVAVLEAPYRSYRDATYLLEDYLRPC